MCDVSKLALVKINTSYEISKDIAQTDSGRIWQSHDWDIGKAPSVYESNMPGCNAFSGSTKQFLSVFKHILNPFIRGNNNGNDF